MIDNHIHIGQFKEIYNDPIEVIQIVMEYCRDGLCFSSLIACDENIAYTKAEKEIENVLAHINWQPEIVRPFFWYNPCYAKQGVMFKKVMQELPYKGVKLHPLANHFDLNDPKITSILHTIFSYAGEYNLPVLIHTGHSGVDSADIFSHFFPLYPTTRFILAHCRPLANTINLMRNFPNVYGDTAFLPEDHLQEIIKEGLAGKMILGSDFPVTNYYNNEKVDLKKQYNSDYEQLKHYAAMLP